MTSVTEVLPHRFPMLLVSEIVRRDSRLVHTRGTVHPEWPPLRDGRCSSPCLLEFLAQSTGILIGGRENGAVSGLLVGVKDAQFLRPWVSSGAILEGIVEIAAEASGYALVNCSAKVDGEDVVTARLQMYRSQPGGVEGIEP